MKNKSLKLISSFIFILTVTSLSVSAQTSKSKQCLAYEPATVTLKGKLTKKAVINASEQKQVIWLLKLEESVCVAADTENEINHQVESITEIQLVLNKEQLIKYRDLRNRTIAVRGSLFAGHTQHHFTDVLLMVINVKRS
jgi:hypothetical protein